MDTLNARVALKHDTDANWALAANTFVPLAGEFCYYETSKKFKIGDGESTVGDLPFIGNEGGGTSELMIETTYNELVNLRDGGDLIPGMHYRITDYETIINGSYNLSVIGAQGYLHNASSAGHPFDIIVRADDESRLNENARAALHDGDTYFLNSNIGGWKLKYSLDNDTTKYTWAHPNGKGVIWWMEDEFNNRAGYDFKNIRFLRYELAFTNPPESYGSDDAYGLSYNAEHQPNRYGSFYHIFAALQGYMQAGTYVNPFTKADENADYDFAVSGNILGTIQFAEPDATYLSAFGADWYYTFDFWDALNFEHIDASLNTLGKVPCRENYIEVETDPVVALLQGVFNVSGLGGSVWETNSVFVESLSEGAWCSISENRLGMHNWANTFGNRCNSITFGNNCYSNTFGNYCYSNTFGNRCNSITFWNHCYGNTFGNSCYGNTFGHGCYDNTFGDDCSYNTFGNSCNFITFGDDCSYNTFGNSCNFITFGNYCSSNTFGDDCYSNTFGNYCYSNTFGDYCYSNTFGDYCYSNTFGNYCSYNTFGDDCYSNTFGNYCSYNTFGDDCSYNTFGKTNQNNELVGNIHQLRSTDQVHGVTITTAEAGINSYTVKTLESYDGVSGHATLITKTGPNSVTAISTTDGTTWTPVNLTATGVSF